MAYPVWQSAQTNTASGTSIVINKPTGTVLGDLLVARISISGSNLGVSVTPPSGWTMIGTEQLPVFVFYKVAGGSEASSYTFSIGSTDTIQGAIHRITGCNPTPINVNAGNAGTGSSIHSVTISGGVTPTAPNTLLMGFLAWTSTNGSPFLSIAVTNNNPTWNAGAAQSLAQDQYGTYAPATTTGNAVGSVTTAASDTIGFILIAIAPGPVTFGSTFSMIASTTKITKVLTTVFGALFSMLSPTLNPPSIWTRQQEANPSTPWTRQTKSTL